MKVNVSVPDSLLKRGDNNLAYRRSEPTFTIERFSDDDKPIGEKVIAKMGPELYEQLMNVDRKLARQYGNPVYNGIVIGDKDFASDRNMAQDEADRRNNIIDQTIYNTESPVAKQQRQNQGFINSVPSDKLPVDIAKDTLAFEKMMDKRAGKKPSLKNVVVKKKEETTNNADKSIPEVLYKETLKKLQAANPKMSEEQLAPWIKAALVGADGPRHDIAIEEPKHEVVVQNKDAEKPAAEQKFNPAENYKMPKSGWLYPSAFRFNDDGSVKYWTAGDFVRPHAHDAYDKHLAASTKKLNRALESKDFTNLLGSEYNFYDREYPNRPSDIWRPRMDPKTGEVMRNEEGKPVFMPVPAIQHSPEYDFNDPLWKEDPEKAWSMLLNAAGDIVETGDGYTQASYPAMNWDKWGLPYLKENLKKLATSGYFTGLTPGMSQYFASAPEDVRKILALSPWEDTGETEPVQVIKKQVKGYPEFYAAKDKKLAELTGQIAELMQKARSLKNNPEEFKKIADDIKLLRQTYGEEMAAKPDTSDGVLEDIVSYVDSPIMKNMRLGAAADLYDKYMSEVYNPAKAKEKYDTKMSEDLMKERPDTVYNDNGVIKQSQESTDSKNLKHMQHRYDSDLQLARKHMDSAVKNMSELDSNPEFVNFGKTMLSSPEGIQALKKFAMSRQLGEGVPARNYQSEFGLGPDRVAALIHDYYNIIFKTGADVQKPKASNASMPSKEDVAKARKESINENVIKSLMSSRF